MSEEQTTLIQERAMMAKALDCPPLSAYWPPAEILDAMWRFKEKDKNGEFPILCHWLMRLMNA